MAKSKAHILLLGGDGGYSGVPSYIEQVSLALAGRARLSIVCDRNKGGYDFARKAGHKTHEIAGLRSSLNPWRMITAARDLARLIAQDPPDLIWAHARMAVLLLRLLSIWQAVCAKPMPPLAITLHGLPFGPGHRPLARQIAYLMERAFLRAMPRHHLLFLSQSAAEIYANGPGGLQNGTLKDRAKAPILRHKTHILQNCSHLAPLPALAPGERPDPRPCVIMTGRRSYQKNQMAAAEIFGHLPKDYRLILCGSGTDDPGFIAKFQAAAGLSPQEAAGRVRYLGPQADIRPLLQQADLFLLTSRYEGMPIAAIEAFEAGLPIAVANVSGLPEICAHHPLSALIEPTDPAQCAQDITTLMTRYRQDPMAQNAAIRAAWAAEFSFTLWREKLIALSGDLLDPI